MKTVILSALLLTVFFLFAYAPGLVYAQGMNPGKDPIEITADKTLEWHRTELQYVANGNAMVKQGTTTIKGDRIIADYRDGTETNIDIYRLTAIGTVSIDDRGNVATGDRLVYDVDSGVATMTGDALTMTTPEQIVTAKDSFEYTVAQGKIKASGHAKVVRGTDTLYADILTAYLVEDAQGKNTLDRVEGDGNVKIVTPAEMLTGNRGLYRAADNTAIVTGAVKITRDQNVLTGERAEIDLTTSISRLFGSSIEDGQTGGRVRAVFYPEGPENKPEENKKPAAPAPRIAPATPVIAPPAPIATAPTPTPILIPARKPQPSGAIIVPSPDVLIPEPSLPIAIEAPETFRPVPPPNSISRPLDSEKPAIPAPVMLDDLAR